MRCIVSHGVNGLLAEEASPESLAATLGKLMSDSTMRCRLGEEARRTAKRFTPKLIFDQWEELLTEMASRKGHTIFNGFAEEPFSLQAELSRLARQEWLFRQEEAPLPRSSAWLMQRTKHFISHIRAVLAKLSSSSLFFK